MIDNILQSLGLAKTNSGTWCGTGGWLQDDSARRIDSINPATGESHRQRAGHDSCAVRAGAGFSASA